jgi:hypothetical protein
MKKNAMMKIAAILMVAVLLTTCAISSTFAKYVSNDSTTSSARVAKWGVTVTVSDNDTAFALEYADDGAVKVESSVKEDTVDGSGVVTAKKEYVVAPGTKNSKAIDILVDGTPEVATLVTAKASDDSTNFVKLANWELGTGAEKTFCPIIFTVNGATYRVGVDTDNSDKNYYVADATALQTAVNAAIVEVFKTTSFAANKPVDATLIVGWEWEFNGDDTNDTRLGDKAEAGTPATIAFDFVISVEQDGPSDDLYVAP